MSGALYSHTTRGAIVLTPAIYNADHQNHIDNGDAAHLGGASADVTAMQSTTDPGGVGSESLAASLADELKRIRFALARIVGGSKKWYEAPSSDLDSSLYGHLYGLTLSNNAGDATNDLDIAAGRAASSAAVTGIMVLASGITKRLDGSWAVGSGNGGLDTGSIANVPYHIYLIRRPDTGVVDALFSASATSPTLPANYTQSRRIGSLRRVAGALQAFHQVGDEFRLTLSVDDISLSSLSAATALRTLASIPTGIEFEALLSVGVGDAASVIRLLYVDYPGESDASNGIAVRMQVAGIPNIVPLRVRVNTSGQVQTTLTGSGSTGILVLTTRGWIDGRGRLG